MKSQRRVVVASVVASTIALAGCHSTDATGPSSGNTLDLGPLIVEYFALGIDPYPRAPGAVLPPEATDSDSPEEGSPFAALAALRSDPKDSG